MSTERAIVCALVLCFLFTILQRWSRNPNIKPVHDPDNLNQPLPDPDPLRDFDLVTARTRNHVYVNKPLRYPYFQTMAHQPMQINDWIEIDSDYEWYLAEKANVIAQQGKRVVDSLPENDAACQELLEILADWLPKRYPTLFQSLGADGIWNKVTGEKWTRLGSKQGVDALMVISRLVQDDFLMAREREDGRVYFVGGLVAFPGKNPHS